MRILLVEPDPVTAAKIELALRSEGFLSIYTTDLGSEAVDLAKLYDYDAVLLELRLPDMSGFEVIRALRLAKVPTPIVVVTGMAEVADKVRAFGFGADDYLTKPFHTDELVARIHTVVRRSHGNAEAQAVFGNLVIELSTANVRVAGNHVHLTAKEYALLEVMALRPNKTITKEMFLNHLYGGMDEPEVKIIDVFIFKLRRKLALAKWTGGKIDTVWGRGFMLTTPEVAGGDAGAAEQYIADAVAA